MSEDLKDLFGMLIHNVKVGLGHAGKRASASALKSVMKDGQKITRAVEKRFSGALDKLEEMIGPDEEK